MRHFLFSGLALALAFAALLSPLTRLSLERPLPAAAPALAGPQGLLPPLGVIQRQAQDHARMVADIMDQMNSLPRS